MSIVVQGRILPLQFEQSLKDVVKAELKKSVLAEVTDLKKRIQQGRTPDGLSFKPYSPQYAKKRRAKGRQTNHVDLIFSGAMLRAIQTKVEDNGKRLKASIFFGSAKEAAKAHGNQARRNFFGLSSSQVDRITANINKAISNSNDR